MNVGESTMADKNNNDQNALFDVEKNTKTYADFAERSQRIVSAFLEQQKAGALPISSQSNGDQGLQVGTLHWP